MTSYNVPYYLNFKNERIESICQYDAHRLKLDNMIVLLEVRKIALQRQENYDDSLGTNGFIRWISNICHEVCKTFSENEEIYNRAKYEAEALIRNPIPSFIEGGKTHTDIIFEVGQKIDEGIHASPISKDPHENELLKCNRCKKDKPRKEFYNTKATKTGKFQPCKQCINDKKSGIGTPKKEAEKKALNGNLSDFSFSDSDIDHLIEMTEIKVNRLKAIFQEEFKRAEETKGHLDEAIKLLEKIKRRKK